MKKTPIPRLSETNASETDLRKSALTDPETRISDCETSTDGTLPDTSGTAEPIFAASESGARPNSGASGRSDPADRTAPESENRSAQNGFTPSNEPEPPERNSLSPEPARDADASTETQETGRIATETEISETERREPENVEAAETERGNGGMTTESGTAADGGATSDGEAKLPPPPKPESNKKKWAKRILLIVVFAFTFYAMYLITSALGGGDVASLATIMEATDMRFFVSAVLLACFLFFSEAFKFSILSRMTVKKFHYGACFTTGVIGKFYDSITPFATGGQPFQMVHLAKKGYPTGVATAIPTLKYIIQLYVFILVSITLYIINPGALDYLAPTSRGVIQTACYVGLVFAVSAPSLFVFFSLAPKTADKVVSFFIRLLAKIKLVKDFDKTHGKVLNFVESYQLAFKQLFGKGWGILFLVLICIADCLLYFAFPYFLLVGMGGTRPSWKLMLDVATLNSYSFFAASLIPTPGNSGAIEASYSMVFAPVAVNEGTLFWIVFIWRFLTYYLYIFVGIFFNLGRYVQRKLRARREKIGERRHL